MRSYNNVLYRVHRKISVHRDKPPIAVGIIDTLDEIKPAALQALLDGGTVSVVQTAPLAEIPAYEKISESLERKQIITPVDFYLTDTATLRKILRKTNATIESMKQAMFINWIGG